MLTLYMTERVLYGDRAPRALSVRAVCEERTLVGGEVVVDVPDRAHSLGASEIP